MNSRLANKQPVLADKFFDGQTGGFSAMVFSKGAFERTSA
jgi:hypothetical protein